MSTLTTPPPADAPQDRALTRLADEHSFALRLAAVLVAFVAAYHYSLLTLVRTLGLETPLAYLGLVPLMALGIAATKARPSALEPDLHDRQIDVIVATPLLVGAVLVQLLLPERLDTLFWVYRVDLLSMPLFAAGSIALIFGVRALWRLRVAVLFLLLAWPLPWTAVLDRWLQGFTDLTIYVLDKSMAIFPFATRSTGSDTSLFTIVHDGVPFDLSVATACSGVNSVVGFLLVGVAGMALVKGRRGPKLTWLVGGVVLIWGLNLARLVLLFWVGESFGEKVAIDGLHPFIGLVLFSLGILAMALVMPLFGLSVPAAKRRTAPDPAAVPAHRRAVPKARGAIAVLAVLTVFMGVANAGMSRYGLFADGLGAPRLIAFEAATGVPGYSGQQTNSYDQFRRFFGGDSTWNRFSYRSTTDASGIGMTVDVVSTSELSRLSDYGVEDCYSFHGYDTTPTVKVDLGGGVTARQLSYTDPDDGKTWQVNSWVWPVTSPKGTRYERVTLLTSSADDEAEPGVVRAGGANNVQPVGVTDGLVRPAPSVVQQQQLAFARAVVSSRAAAQPVADPAN